MPTISFRADDEFAQYLDDRCTQTGLSKSDLIKRLVVDGIVTDSSASRAQERELIYHLNRIGNNLNQIAKYCNSKKLVDKLVLDQLIEIERLVNGSSNFS